MIVDFAGDYSVSQISEVRISNLTNCFNNKERMREVTPHGHSGSNLGFIRSEQEEVESENLTQGTSLHANIRLHPTDDDLISSPVEAELTGTSQIQLQQEQQQ